MPGSMLRAEMAWFVSLNPHRVAQRCKRWAGGSVWLFSLIMVLAVIAAERHSQKGRRVEGRFCVFGESQP